MKEEMMLLLEELNATDLYALYPVMKHLAREREKRTLVSK
ncbi:hypothetical protein GCM10020370_09350 [Paenibacillus hodogayensis]